MPSVQLWRSSSVFPRVASSPYQSRPALGQRSSPIYCWSVRWLSPRPTWPKRHPCCAAYWASFRRLPPSWLAASYRDCANGSTRTPNARSSGQGTMSQTRRWSLQKRRAYRQGRSHDCQCIVPLLYIMQITDVHVCNDVLCLNRFVALLTCFVSNCAI